VSVLTWMEIHVGVLKKLRTDPTQGRMLESWLTNARNEFHNRTFFFDDKASMKSAPIRLLRTRGDIDILIAGTALAHRMPLVTRNINDFADIPGLTLINPWE